MAKMVIKNEGEKVQAWELGLRTSEEMMRILTGSISYVGNGNYEIFTRENETDVIVNAEIGDFFKIDEAGYLYIIKHDCFIKSHKHIGGNLYEQLPTPLIAWEKNDPIIPEVQFLINDLGAEHWKAQLEVISDSIIVFFSITRDENANITGVGYDFITYDEFNPEYHYFE